MKYETLSILAVLLTIGCAAAASAGSDQIWKDTDTTMKLLLQEKYEVVDTHFLWKTTDLNQYREVVYLQKDTELYRCVTIKKSRGNFFHECHVVENSKD